MKYLTPEFDPKTQDPAEEHYHVATRAMELANAQKEYDKLGALAKMGVTRPV
jgi:hypothetical protein